MIRFWKIRRPDFRSESGAVTVDWVVLTALVVSLGFIVGYAVWGPAGERAAAIAEQVVSDVNSLMQCGETSCGQ